MPSIQPTTKVENGSRYAVSIVLAIIAYKIVKMFKGREAMVVGETWTKISKKNQSIEAIISSPSFSEL